MIVSLIRSWTSKARNALYDLINWFRCKRGQESDIIPRYERREWNYGYMLINDNTKRIVEQKQKTKKYHQIIGINSTRQETNKSSRVSSNLGGPSHSTLASNPAAAGRIQPPVATWDESHSLKNKTITTSISKKKNATIKTAQRNNVTTPSTQKREKRKRREENKINSQRRRQEQKENETDIILSITSVVFKDDDITYTDMRTRAHQALVKKMATRKEGDDAFKNGDKKLGKQLLAKSQLYHTEMKKLNKQAADHKFNDINKGRPSNVIDLHGLFVNEARERVKKAIKICQSENKSEMILIVGNGNHSYNKVPKLKPAMIEFIKSLDLEYTPNKPNSGCVLVQLREPSLISLD